MDDRLDSSLQRHTDYVNGLYLHYDNSVCQFETMQIVVDLAASIDRKLATIRTTRSVISSVLYELVGTSRV